MRRASARGDELRLGRGQPRARSPGRVSPLSANSPRRHAARAPRFGAQRRSSRESTRRAGAPRRQRGRTRDRHERPGAPRGAPDAAAAGTTAPRRRDWIARPVAVRRRFTRRTPARATRRGLDARRPRARGVAEHRAPPAPRAARASRRRSARGARARHHRRRHGAARAVLALDREPRAPRRESPTHSRPSAPPLATSRPRAASISAVLKRPVAAGRDADSAVMAPPDARERALARRRRRSARAGEPRVAARHRRQRQRRTRGTLQPSMPVANALGRRRRTLGDGARMSCCSGCSATLVALDRPALASAPGTACRRACRSSCCRAASASSGCARTRRERLGVERIVVAARQVGVAEPRCARGCRAPARRGRRCRCARRPSPRAPRRRSPSDRRGRARPAAAAGTAWRPSGTW